MATTRAASHPNGAPRITPRPGQHKLLTYHWNIPERREVVLMNILSSANGRTNVPEAIKLWELLSRLRSSNKQMTHSAKSARPVITKLSTCYRVVPVWYHQTSAARIIRALFGSQLSVEMPTPTRMG
jgi:hypothetical protein